MDTSEERALRKQAMEWLDARPSERVDYSFLAEFEYAGQRMPLKDRGRGIRKPAGFQAALSISTTYTAPSQTPPYVDAIGTDGLQRYAYRGTDPRHAENIALRNAMKLKLPLIWFVAVAKSQYEPIYPVWVVGDEPQNLQFVLAVDEAQRFLPTGASVDADTRAYALQLTKRRLHQPVFRMQVMLAYGNKCAICRLAHPELLDAAHIIEDGKPKGTPVVPNGLSLCKIHHAAFDSKLLGVRPDLTLHVRTDVLQEVDGWMLKGGIQGVHNKKLEVVPSNPAARPDPDRLEVRYSEFLAS